ncbi:hypothetical protein DTL21_19250 [Bremerella cremea]|uniref:Uncharacterized protein n=1 Tax=Blastopirellula marina TaxID=124 RepID=A0A2S8FJJ2_9BACT|nr:MULTISPECIES: hypothetical protein [Pirellulaceae]PQO32359.1 hypothetical protein C5Y83_19230 [Blastopirellula marina]RCS45426.1 hypothetical protein DTL21_19250 [Bremerella cremea]
MHRNLDHRVRRGSALKGPILMFGGVTDLALAAGLWFMMGQGDMVISLVCVFLALTGLGVIGFGLITTLRNT